MRNNKFLLTSHIRKMLLKMLLKRWSKVISIRMKSNGIGMIRNKFYILLCLWLREKATFIIHRIQ